MSDIPQSMLTVRRQLSEHYLKGDGIEIGALHHPLHVPEAARVRYVDRLPVAELRRQYPELANFPLTEPDIIDDGEVLSRIPEASLDFIIANHMLEHCENPLGAMRNHLGRLRRGGILYYAIPDKRQCFDVDRDLTTFEHLVADDREGPDISRFSHYREWAVQVNRLTVPQDIERNIEALAATRYSIHFHVWDEATFRDFVARSNRYLDYAFREVCMVANGTEAIAVLQRSG